MGKKIHTFMSSVVKEAFCEVHFNHKEETPYVKFYDEKGKLIREETYPGHSLPYAVSAAENWASGIKSY